ncbi:hypothetical protein [Vibrio tapetis]|uniref:Uncharacterized protein n=1 Tax=Vibrio tapetis subsp. tapetis TaxID=1671868 RepID=A0A2N8ZMT1_9VIBR|nr:hypothetical protein [Vibrio tapetis]SON53234.1 protein of unknown function [Vibrio tapetis subsp. tapetis]
MIKQKQTIVIIGRTSGFGEAVANHSLGDANIIHVAGLSTGLDVNDEKQTVAYFESIGAFDHLMITVGSYAPPGKNQEKHLKQRLLTHWQSATNT